MQHKEMDVTFLEVRHATSILYGSAPNQRFLILQLITTLFLLNLIITCVLAKDWRLSHDNPKGRQMLLFLDSS